MTVESRKVLPRTDVPKARGIEVHHGARLHLRKSVANYPGGDATVPAYCGEVRRLGVFAAALAFESASSCFALMAEASIWRNSVFMISTSPPA
jgi:hypothetical protein